MFLTVDLERFNIHANPSQDVSPILLLDGLVMITNEALIASRCFEEGNLGRYLL